jgi:hypothetical protein
LNYEGQEHQASRISPGDRDVRRQVGVCPSENAVKSQVWIAVATYVLVAIARKRPNVELSLHTMFQGLRDAFRENPSI